jgi:tetratricopeptide (TPR) repeat protein
MSDTLHCPDCGHENPPGFTACSACGFPLGEAPAGPAPPAAPAAAAAPHITIRRPLPRPRPRGSQQATTLWLVFGTFAALMVIWVAIKANVDRATQPVEGSNPQQQVNADSLVRVLQQDSTNVSAQVELANIFYDTGNWNDAIVHYRSALRMDSSLVSALVDLGVCYYNLGSTEDADRHFRLALVRDPHQPVALFNLGIVCERRKDYREALDFYHRALQTAPPEEIKQAIVAGMQRIEQAQGLQPKPLPGSSPTTP